MPAADARDLEAEIDRLYGLPLSGFTAARSALAARLREEGRRDEVGAITRLPRPSLSAWAVNLLIP